MKKLLLSTAVLALLTLNSYGYDTVKAKELHTFYSHMTQKACADSTLFISAKAVMKMVKAHKSLLLLDVRTPGETSVVRLGKNTLHLPINTLFQKESLDKLPTDKPIMIVCHSGIRATMAAMGLKRVGFKNVHVVKGGIVALAAVDTPKSAPSK